MRDAEQVRKLVDRAVSEFRRIDIMIYNAGLMQQSPLDSGKIEEWDNMIDLNIKGVLNLISELSIHLSGRYETERDQLS